MSMEFLKQMQVRIAFKLKLESPAVNIVNRFIFGKTNSITKSEHDAV